MKIFVYNIITECEDEEDCPGDWTDDQLCFTATKRISVIRMDVEATDTPRSLEAFHRLLQESSKRQFKNLVLQSG